MTSQKYLLQFMAQDIHPQLANINCSVERVIIAKLLYTYEESIKLAINYDMRIEDCRLFVKEFCKNIYAL